MARSVVIGTAGHIDHGKTALIRALTGTDTDRLPEEKRRGITIDLGFASTEMLGSDGVVLRLSFIDVPGHKLFIRNMLAGAGSIDCAMLVISADEGVKPQTEEHLAICTLLGVTRGLTVLSKADAVSASRLEEVGSSVREYLRGSFLDGAPVLPVSALTGAGLPTLRRSLAELGKQAMPRDAGALPRLAVDRAFVMKGFGTVVTGTLQSGTVSVGEALALEPGRRSVRVRGLQVHGHSQDEAQAGSRVALNLSGVDVAEVHRGDTVVLPGSLETTQSVDVEVTLLPESPAVKHRTLLQFHAFTAETPAAVSLYEYAPVEGGETRIMRLKLGKPVLLLPGDRFVLRQPSPPATIGGGRVLDAYPLPRCPKKKSAAWLRRVQHADGVESLFLRVERKDVDGLSLGRLALEVGSTPARAVERLGPALASGRLVRLDSGLMLTREALASARQRILDIVRTTASAAAGGHKLPELRHTSGLSAAVFQFALNALVEHSQLALRGEQVFPHGADPSASDADARRLAAISTVYSTAGLAAPPLAEVAGKLKIGEPEMRRLVTLLLRKKTLVRLGQENLYLHGDALQDLRAKITALRGQLIDVGRFKEMTGLSRKYAIPLLEYLDREHLTRKQGEHRVVL